MGELKYDLPFLLLEEVLRELHDHYSGNPYDKRAILKYSEERLDARDQSLIRQMVNTEGFAPILTEQVFIRDADISVQRHLRYLPPFSHAHDFFEIVYLATGNCLNIFTDCVFEMEPGDLFIIPPGVSHAIQVFNDYSEVYNLLVRRSTFESAFSNMIESEDVISQFYRKVLYDTTYEKTLRVKADQSYSELIRVMYSEENDSSPQHRLIQISYFQLLMAFIGRDCFEKITFVGSEKKSDNLIADVLHCIKVSCSSIDLPKLAERFGYSTAHMSRLIQKHTGYGFAELLKKIRMQRAAALLRSASSVPIDEVMSTVGYSGKSHFYINFKEMYGMTPSVYREAYREEMGH